MWAHYKKTFIPSQLMILAMCAALRMFVGLPWVALLVVFVLMQVGSLLGAIVGSLLKRSVLKDDDDVLPLQRRRGL